MNRYKLEQYLNECGFWHLRDRTHSIWTNGAIRIPVPHHREINIFLAKKIMKQAEKAMLEQQVQKVAA